MSKPKARQNALVLHGSVSDLMHVPTAGNGIVEISPLTDEEQEQLRVCEETFRKHEQAFREFAGALQMVRDCRLYRTNYLTFEEYCRAILGRSRQYAHRIAKAGEVIAQLPLELQHLVTNENCARALDQVQIDKRPEVLASIQAKGKQPTGASIISTARKMGGILKSAKQQTRRKADTNSSNNSQDDAASAVGAVIFKIISQLYGRIRPVSKGRVDRIGKDVREKSRQAFEKVMKDLKAHKHTGAEERQILLKGAVFLAAKYLPEKERTIVVAATAALTM